jgi:hypothetical protein
MKNFESRKETLAFIDNCWFGELPQKYTNQFIAEIKAWSLIIPWMELDPKNIDLKNGHFWESLTFTNSEKWINAMAKTNLVQFVNKAISWDKNTPLPVEAIVNGTLVVDPLEFKGLCSKAWIVDGMGFKYNQMLENLRKNNKA